MSALSEVNGIGKKTEEKLIANEIDTIEKLAELDIDKLVALEITKSTSEKILKNAQEYIKKTQAETEEALKNAEEESEQLVEETSGITTTQLGVALIVLATMTTFGLLAYFLEIYIFILLGGIIAIVLSFGAFRLLKLKEYTDKIEDSKLFIVYIHGVGQQKKSFADAFHGELTSLITSHTAYSEKEVNEHLIKVPIHWYKELQTIWHEKEKDTYKQQYVNSVGANNLSKLRYWVAIILFVYLLTAVSVWLFGRWGLIGLILVVIVFGQFYRKLITEILPGIVTNQSYNILDPVARELIYFGDRDKRNEVLKKINNEIKSKTKGIKEPNVCFITHSFGTVLAFDFLYQTGYFFQSTTKKIISPKTGRQDLEKPIKEKNPPNFILKLFVTMGSPLPLV